MTTLFEMMNIENTKKNILVPNADESRYICDTPISRELNKINQSNEKLINLDYLNEISEGDQDFIREMISLFIVNTPISLEEIRHSFEKNDFVKLKSEIHKLKSSFNLLGIEQVSQCIISIEKELERGGNNEKLKKQLNEFDELSHESLDEVRSIMKKGN